MILATIPWWFTWLVMPVLIVVGIAAVLTTKDDAEGPRPR